jgi:DNA (cytosine-5)-methyltransferase 1
MPRIPIIDLFAGPGGLGEGFSNYVEVDGNHPFKIGLSIEKDPFAQQTLSLRAFYRWFVYNNLNVPKEYYDYLSSSYIARDVLFKKYPDAAIAAEREAQQITLGDTPPELVDKKIKAVIGGQSKWLLIGGPPCQAYSLVGRSRILGQKKNILLADLDLGGMNVTQLFEQHNIAKDRALKDFSTDARHTLYREYLRIIAKHAPSVFVMENVRGILSSKVNNQLIFPQILKDLKHPYGVAHEYWPNKHFADNRYFVFSLVTGRQPDEASPADFLIKSENYGIPQSRHRVILLGIRSDLVVTRNIQPESLNKSNFSFTVKDVLEDLPKLRSGVSDGWDSLEHWLVVLQNAKKATWFTEVIPEVRSRIQLLLDEIERLSFPRQSNAKGSYLKDQRLVQWFNDPELSSLPNHEARSHMSSDLHRYLFATAFCEIKSKTPKLEDFPPSLLPDHRNVVLADVKSTQFSDRFRVQLWGMPSTTVTSHISKDGHYFIHPDPLQCRSLTVREAARLQTFPDNYFFEGSRTEQFKQVGNAVPPLLARHIAEIVYGVLK